VVVLVIKFPEWTNLQILIEYLVLNAREKEFFLPSLKKVNEMIAREHWLKRTFGPKPYDVRINPYTERCMSFNLPTGKVQLPNFKGLICLDGERRVEESDLMMDKIIVGFTHEILHKILLEKEGLGTTLRWDLRRR
jgi:hypothetical protein